METPEGFIKSSIEELNQLFSQEQLHFQFPVTGTPLYRACAVIGQALNHPFSPMTEAEESIEELCKSSGIRYRQIVLDTKWWKKEHGPLLCYHKETKEPVALLRSGKKSWMILPAAYEKKIVDATIAKDIFPLAIVFYPPLPEPKANLWNLVSFCFRGTQKQYIFLVFLSVMSVLISFFVPFATKLLFDNAIPNYHFSLLAQLILGLAAATLSLGMFQWTRSLLILHLSGFITERMQTTLWDKLLKLPIRFFKMFPSGDLIQRTFILDILQKELSATGITLLLNSVFSLFYIFIMLYFSATLTFLGICATGITISITLLISVMKVRYERDILVSNAKIYSFLTQIIEGIAKIRSAAAEQFVIAKWASEFAINQRAILFASNLEVYVRAFTTMMRIFVTLAIYSAILWMIGESKEEFEPVLAFTIGTYLAFMAAFTPFFEAVYEISNRIASLIKLIPFWERAHLFFQTEAEDVQGSLRLPIHGALQIKNLSFRYSPHTPLILQDVHIHANPGEFIGILGPTGSGKSTILRLLIGFEAIDHGKIFYDGHDISSLNLPNLRKQVGAILQNSKIFFGSVYENLVCGERFSVEEVKEALDLSTFSQDIHQFPMGLDTILTTGGNTLSGGQRQRLLIARLFLRRPKIMLLDEATSSLDFLNENRIMSCLEKMKATRIVVTHRLHTLKKADRVYFIEKGSITGSGTLDELIHSIPRVSKLAKTQKV